IPRIRTARRWRRSRRSIGVTPTRICVAARSSAWSSCMVSRRDRIRTPSRAARSTTERTARPTAPTFRYSRTARFTCAAMPVRQCSARLRHGRAFNRERTMDMGIKGRKAIVCAASKGLGKGCAMALAGEGVDLVINARTKSELDATAEEIRKKHGVKVTAVAVDVTTEEGRKQVLAACPEPDIIVNNAGGPPPGNFRDWNRDDWIK